MTIKYQSYFVKGRVADNLALGLPTDENVASWEKLLREVVFGKLFKNHMTHGFNVGLGVASSEILTYDDEIPRSQGDVKRLLFLDAMTGMVKGGEYGIPMACLWMWVYYLLMEGCVSNWVENAVGDYITTAGYNIVLGTQHKGEAVASTHCFYRIGQKAATNSFQTLVH